MFRSIGRMSVEGVFPSANTIIAHMRAWREQQCTTAPVSEIDYARKCARGGIVLLVLTILAAMYGMGATGGHLSDADNRVGFIVCGCYLFAGGVALYLMWENYKKEFRSPLTMAAYDALFDKETDPTYRTAFRQFLAGRSCTQYFNYEVYGEHHTSC